MRWRNVLWLGSFVCCALLTACSPVYMVRTAAGHVRFLSRRRGIAKALQDPATPPELKKKLELVQDIREFGFSRMGLRRSAAYSTYSPVDGPYLTYLVSGAEKTRLKPYLWKFLFIGTFPYKGHFKKEQAVQEKAWLEKRGYDATVRGVAAYNTPLWIADPLPTTLLDYSAGDLADTLLHELMHGTVYFKNQSGFDEAVATFVGEQGAQDFLAERFGKDSKQLLEFQGDLGKEREAQKVMDALYDRLDALYASTATVSEKLSRREEIFSRGKKELAAIGYDYPYLNNAVILANRLYHENLDLFGRAFEKEGRDWPKMIALLKALDRRDPWGDLESRLR